MITLQKHVFTSAGKRKQKQNDIDLNEDEISELENAEFLETEASKLIQEGDIVVIKMRRPLLLPPKLTKDPYETTSLTTDGYGHELSSTPPRC